MPRKTKKTKQRVKRKVSRKRYSRKKVSRKRYSRKRVSRKRIHKKRSTRQKKSKYSRKNRNKLGLLGSMRKSRLKCGHVCPSVDIEGNVAGTKTFEEANVQMNDIEKVEGETMGFFPLTSYKNLLTQNGYYQDPFVSNFIAKNMKGDPGLENLKEVRIASFTNYYRCSIYALVEI